MIVYLVREWYVLMKLSPKQNRFVRRDYYRALTKVSPGIGTDTSRILVRSNLAVLGHSLNPSVPRRMLPAVNGLVHWPFAVGLAAKSLCILRWVWLPGSTSNRVCQTDLTMIACLGYSNAWNISREMQIIYPEENEELMVRIDLCIKLGPLSQNAAYCAKYACM